VGNSCAVWEAIRGNEEERFALKVLRQDLREDKREMAFLKHEFEVAHELKHPNVIRIHEFNTEGNTPYLVLELYSEQNMKQALRAGPDAWSFFVPKIIEQSAEALYHVHSKGWVHCDVKPDNLLVSPQGDAKLIDFTIAERIGRSQVGLFGKGKRRGTRSYMSPEQIRGKRLDPRSDVYAFGCVVFELLTGRAPFTGTSADDLLQKHLQAGIPNVQVMNSNITNEGAELIKRTMSKEAKDRPADMWEFLKEFRALRLFKRAPRKPDGVE